MVYENRNYADYVLDWLKVVHIYYVIHLHGILGY